MDILGRVYLLQLPGKGRKGPGNIEMCTSGFTSSPPRSKKRVLRKERLETSLV